MRGRAVCMRRTHAMYIKAWHSSVSGTVSLRTRLVVADDPHVPAVQRDGHFSGGEVGAAPHHQPARWCRGARWRRRSPLGSPLARAARRRVFYFKLLRGDPGGQAHREALRGRTRVQKLSAE
eukprot:575634-Prorocentrum_minimum.AAC.1